MIGQAVDMLQTAIHLIKANKFADAEVVLLKFVSSQPLDFDALHMLGVVSSELGKTQQAERYFASAHSIDPKHPPLLQNWGLYLHKQNNFVEAVDKFSEGIRLAPNYPPIYSDRGNALTRLRRYDEALSDHNQAIKLSGNFFAFYFNRANTLHAKKEYAAALADYEHAIRLNPHYAEAFNGRGNVYASLKRHEEALAAYDHALSLKSDLAEAWLGRGNVFYELKRYDEARAAYDRSLSIKPALENAWLGRIRTKLALRNTSEAQQDREQAVLAGVSEEILNFEFARYGAIHTPASVPKTLIEDVFDEYAPNFDSHLVETLNYIVPANLITLIRRFNENSGLDVLDIGCGTGLMGATIRPAARNLVGVDLSRRMLDKAKDRGIYDELICKDISEFMEEDPRDYDLVTSADVFVYVGDLSKIFKLAGRRLRQNGYFAFSVEATDAQDYVLSEAGRYKHSKQYLNRLAMDSGFEVCSIEDCIIRSENTQKVPGFLVLMSRQ
jgi:predicted TPR repeat methyltransferase